MYRISESSHYGLYRLTSSSVSSSFLILTQYSGNSIDFIYWSIDLKLTKRPISNTNHTKFPSNSTRGRTSNQNLKPATSFLNHWEWRVNLIRASQTILLHWTLQPILLVFSHRNLYLIQGQPWQRRCATVFFFCDCGCRPGQLSRGYIQNAKSHWLSCHNTWTTSPRIAQAGAVEQSSHSHHYESVDMAEKPLSSDFPKDELLVVKIISKSRYILI